MSDRPETPLLDTVLFPADIRKLDKEQLPQLADELRRETISAVSVTGGHLGAGLGVVELTVALHYVFDTPHDKLVWDVGHQAYPHKIVTGRRDRIRTLRQGAGLSGFTRRSESEFDPFGAAHSSTSISAALGFAIANKLSDDPGKAIAVIGDGALSAGMAYEAMNNAAAAGNRLIVILNDNDMSIAPPVGSLRNSLARLVSSSKYLGPRKVAQKIARMMPDAIHDWARKAEEYTRGWMTGGTLFEELGFYYVGPVDGHNVEHWSRCSRTSATPRSGRCWSTSSPRRARAMRPPKMPPTNIMAWSSSTSSRAFRRRAAAGRRATPASIAKALTKEMERDEKVVAITAAMPSGTGLDKVAEKFPDRTFDVGIAEQHAVTFAAGLAAQGYKPFATIYSTFLQRAYDQVVHDVAIQNLPVRFAMDRAGLVGADGATHAGSFDLAYLCTLPNFVVMAAADEAELCHMVHTMALHDSGPIAVRYPRGEGRGRSATGTAAGARDRQGPDHSRGQEGRDSLARNAARRSGESGRPARRDGSVDDRGGPSLRKAARQRADPEAADYARGCSDRRGSLDRRPRRSRADAGDDEGLADAGLKIRTMRLPDTLPGSRQARKAI